MKFCAPILSSPRVASQKTCTLQRKCACGEDKASSGECPECERKKKLGLQAKLMINRPGDQYEREADRIADHVVDPSMSDGASPLTIHRVSGGLVSQGSASDQDVQPGRTPTEASIESALRGGNQLDNRTRRHMESRFGHDFSRVRIHMGGVADAASRAVQARAFTMGHHVVFRNGHGSPGSSAGQRLLAHELTHVIQQTGPSPNPGGSGLVQRNPDESGIPSPDAPVPSGPAPAIARAELMCDIAALCRLKRVHPEAVSEARIRTVTRRCRPWVTSPLSPCLNPAALMPLSDLLGKSPATTSPTKPGANKASSAKPSAFAGLSGLTKFKFNLGNATFNVDLPSSATAKLPVKLRGAFRLTFTFKAESSGKFLFSIILDGIPHVQIEASTTLDAAGKSGSGDLSISSTHKTCHAPNAAESKKSLESAGKKLKEAMVNFNQPIDPTADEVIERGKRIASVVGGISDVNKAVEKAKGKCKGTSTVSFGLQSKFPISKESETVPFFGAGLKVHF